MIFEKMRDRLSAVRLYAPDAFYLNTELTVYAEELERSRAELDHLLREMFIPTAEAEGLSEYERLFGLLRENEAAAKRREMLLLRMSLREDDFTPSGIRRALDGLGVSYELSEYPTLQKLSVIVTSEHTLKEKAFIARQIAELVPVHLDYQLSFNTLTWDQLDHLERTFDAIDSENLTWDQADNRTNEE